MPIYKVLEKCMTGEVRVIRIGSLITRYRKIFEEIKKIRTIVTNNGEALLDLLASDIQENSDFRKILKEALVETNDVHDLDIEMWFKKIHEFVVERISFPENTLEADHVRIMSLYASKELSAKYVIIVSAIDELIPNLDRYEDENREKQLEEQRRLFYVAVTRCKSSDSGYPGTLIISSFVCLPGSEALTLGINASPDRVRSVKASRFIRDFEETAPATIAQRK